MKRILLTGSTGFLGQKLKHRLRAEGRQVFALDRRPAEADGIAWPAGAAALREQLPQDLDAVIHLAGAPVAGGLWTRRRRDLLLSSRVNPTSLLVEALAGMDSPPRALLSASAIGGYDPSASQPGNEETPFTRSTFLGRVCSDWEEEALRAQEAGMRVALLRTGLVLDPAGGLLARLLPMWRLGLGGRIGPASVGYSWIHGEDWLAAVIHLLDHDASGPYNLVAPGAVTQGCFVTCLARALHRPAILHVPALPLNLLPGDMGRELFLNGLRLQPANLLRSGFDFRHPELPAALDHLLNS